MTSYSSTTGNDIQWYTTSGSTATSSSNYISSFYYINPPQQGFYCPLLNRGFTISDLRVHYVEKCERRFLDEVFARDAVSKRMVLDIFANPTGWYSKLTSGEWLANENEHVLRWAFSLVLPG